MYSIYVRYLHTIAAITLCQLKGYTAKRKLNTWNTCYISACVVKSMFRSHLAFPQPEYMGCSVAFVCKLSYMSYTIPSHHFSKILWSQTFSKKMKGLRDHKIHV